jgi:cell division protein FtsW (lipid II flippase)
VLVVGDDVRGSKRWIEFGSFRFQPSELGKVLLILFLAAFVANRVAARSPWRTSWGAVGLAPCRCCSSSRSRTSARR